MVGINFLSALSIKVKAAIVLAVLALIASVIASFFSGAVMSIIIIRIVIAVIVFAVMGYCVGYIIIRYVPEIMALFRIGVEGDSEFNGVESGESDNYGQEQEQEYGHEQDFVSEDGSGFSEMRADDLPNLSGSDSLDPSEGRLGRHLLNTEEVMRHEPTLMAQAIRTMMSKDE